MPAPITIPATQTPVRDGSRDGPDSTEPPACPGCGSPLRSARARSCSAACRQRAYRARRPDPAVAVTTARGSRRTPQGGASSSAARTTAQTVYECLECEQRFVGLQRCPDCHRFCRKLGLGGACPGCDELILIAELLGLEVTG